MKQKINRVLALVALILMSVVPAFADVYTSYTIIDGTPGTNDYNGLPRLLDNDKSCQWQVNELSNPTFVEFSTAEPIVPNGYVLTTGLAIWDKYHNPKSWVIKAKVNESDTEWTTIETVTNDTKLPGVQKTDVTYYIDNSTAYQFFRFEISEIVGSDTYLRLTEFQFLTNIDLTDLTLGSITGLPENGFYEYTGIHWFTGSPDFSNYSILDCVGNKLTEGTHYTLTVTRDGNPATEVKEKGTYLITATAIEGGGYTGTLSVEFEVANKIEIGSGDEISWDNPLVSISPYSLSAQFYTADEISENHSGEIFKGISFHGDYAMTRTIDIYIVHTDLDHFQNKDSYIAPTSSDLVFSGNVDFKQNAWTSIHFDNPFRYLGGNIALIVYDKTGSSEEANCNFLGFRGNGAQVWSWGSSNEIDITSSPTNGGWRSTKNQIQITFEEDPDHPKPTNLTVNELAYNSAKLGWANISTATSWVVECSTDSKFTNIVQTINASENTATITGLTEETTYYARVRAVYEDDGYSGWTTTDFTTPERYPTPTDFSCTSLTATTATLSWTKNGTATEWVVEYGNGYPNVLSVNVSGTPSVTLTGLTPETTYDARVKAVYGEEGESHWTDYVSFEPTAKWAICSGEVGQEISLPLTSVLPYSASMQIYSAEEMGAENANKFIESIDFKGEGYSDIERRLEIYMINVNSEEYEPMTWIAPSESDLVFNDTLLFYGWRTIELSSPFKYTGGDVAIIVYDKTNSGTFPYPFATYSTDDIPSLDAASMDPITLSDLENLRPLYSRNVIRLTFSTTPKPSLPTLTDKTLSTATFNWTENGTATAWVLEYTTDSKFKKNVETINVSDEPTAELTDLLEDTYYYVRVKSVYENGDESKWSSTFKFELTDKQTICSGPETESYYLPFYSSYAKYSVSQQIYTAEEIGEENANTFFGSIAFKLAKTEYSYDDEYTRNLDIYMMNANSDDYDYYDWIVPNANNLVFSGEVTFKEGQWTTIELDAPFLYTGEDMVLMVDDNTGDYISDYLYFASYETEDIPSLHYDSFDFNFIPVQPDEYGYSKEYNKNQIRLSAPTGVLKPAYLTLTDQTESSATITWTELGTSTQWIVEYGLDDLFEVGVQSADVSTDATFTLTDLILENTYYVRVKSVSEEGEYSDWCKPLAIENTSKLIIGTDDLITPYYPICNGYKYSLSQQIFTSEELGVENNGKLIESIDFNLKGVKQCTSNVDIYVVNTDKSAFESANDWVPVTDDDLVFSGDVKFEKTGWWTIHFDTPIEYAGENIAVLVIRQDGVEYEEYFSVIAVPDETCQTLYTYNWGWRQYDINNFGSYDGNMTSYKNHVRIMFGTTPPPSFLSLSAYTGNTATLAWQENGTASNWTLEYSTDSRLVKDVISMEIENDPTITLTNLTPDVNYYARVKSVEGDEESHWSDVCSFMPTQKVIIGTDKAQDDYLPTYVYDKYSSSEQIYTADEIGEGYAGKKLESIAFKCQTSKKFTRDIDIYMVNTDQNSLVNDEYDIESIIASPSDLVFSGEVTFEKGWNTITLDTPFLYDGRNIAVIVDDNTGKYENNEVEFSTYPCDICMAIYTCDDDSDFDPTTEITDWYTTEEKNHIMLGFEQVLTLADDADNNDAIAQANNGIYQVELPRHIKEGVNSMVLPFDLTADDAVEYFGDDAKMYVLYGLKSYQGNYSISFERCDDVVEANRPFLLVSGEELDGVDLGKHKIIAPAEELPSDMIEGFSLIGTYAPTTIGEGEGYYVISNSKLYRVTTDVDVLPTRAFFQLTASSNVKQLNIIFNDDDATEIIDIASGTLLHDGIYDLSGRKVSKPAKGIYIMNGKKVISH